MYVKNEEMGFYISPSLQLKWSRDHVYEAPVLLGLSDSK